MDPADEIKQHIEKLDALVEREGAFVSVRPSGYYANRSGYQRFAIEVLKASIAAAIPGEKGAMPTVAIQDSYLFEKETRKESYVQKSVIDTVTFFADSIAEIREPVEPKLTFYEQIKDALGLLGCAGLVFMIVVPWFTGICVIIMHRMWW